MPTLYARTVVIGTKNTLSDPSVPGHAWIEIHIDGQPVESYGFYPLDNPIIGDGEVIFDDAELYAGRGNRSLGIEITYEQLLAIRQFAVDVNASGTYEFIPGIFGRNHNCATFAFEALRTAGVTTAFPVRSIAPWFLHRRFDTSSNWMIPGLDGLPSPWDVEGWGGIDSYGIDPMVHQRWIEALTARRPPGDPLAIDLDGDGLETVGIGTAPVLFDHNADGIRTGTGWVRGDDAWLALDRNANGSIDSGRELFGVDTLITHANGTVRTASDGFEALRTLDANADGVFDAADAAFADVRLWRDANQDGISQAAELAALAQHGIVSIGLTPNTTTVNLGNGNLITGTATVTRSNGSTTQVNGLAVLAEAVNLDLALNPFYREFTDAVALTEQARALPEMGGSGVVRDLREAMSLGTAAAQALAAAASQRSGATLPNLLTVGAMNVNVKAIPSSPGTNLNAEIVRAL